MDVNTIIPVLSIIVGIVIGFVFNLWRDKISENKEFKHLQIRYQRDFIEKFILVPIISEIDEILTLIDKSYITLFRGEKVITDETVKILWEKSGTVKARIIALDDNILEKIYGEFSEIVSSFFFTTSAGKPNAQKEAFNQIKIAHQKAGNIFDRLKPKLTKIRD